MPPRLLPGTRRSVAIETSTHAPAQHPVPTLLRAGVESKQQAAVSACVVQGAVADLVQVKVSTRFRCLQVNDAAASAVEETKKAGAAAADAAGNIASNAAEVRALCNHWGQVLLCSPIPAGPFTGCATVQLMTPHDLLWLVHIQLHYCRRRVAGWQLLSSPSAQRLVLIRMTHS